MIPFYTSKLNQTYLIKTYKEEDFEIVQIYKIYSIGKTILLELIDFRKDIIENKQNDGKMVSKKN